MLLFIVPKSSLTKDPKSGKSSLIKISLHIYKPFLIIFITKSVLGIRTLEKVKSKFATGQLKSAKSPLQPFTQSLIFFYPIIHSGQVHFKNLATFAVKFLKCV